MIDSAELSIFHYPSRHKQTFLGKQKESKGKPYEQVKTTKPSSDPGGWVLQAREKGEFEEGLHWNHSGCILVDCSVWMASCSADCEMATSRVFIGEGLIDVG